jgi:hypothetical protein
MSFERKKKGSFHPWVFAQGLYPWGWVSRYTILLPLRRFLAFFGSFSGSGAGSTPLKPTLTALPSFTYGFT